MLRRGDGLCTSVFTLGEVLTGPRKRNDIQGIQGIKQFFAGNEIELLPFSLDAADRYSTIRAAAKVHQADAIHLATAAQAGVDLFVTNDKRLWTLTVPGIRFFADLSGKVH
jgi:predicted nucleic acid-binding protein